jgi:hypothetical protein
VPRISATSSTDRGSRRILATDYSRLGCGGGPAPFGLFQELSGRKITISLTSRSFWSASLRPVLREAGVPFGAAPGPLKHAFRRGGQFGLAPVETSSHAERPTAWLGMIRTSESVRERACLGYRTVFEQTLPFASRRPCCAAGAGEPPHGGMAE